jgi:hypothetical protein
MGAFYHSHPESANAKSKAFISYVQFEAQLCPVYEAKGALSG